MGLVGVVRKATSVLVGMVIVRVKVVTFIEMGSRDALGRREGWERPALTGERVGSWMVLVLVVVVVMVVVLREGGRDGFRVVALGVEGKLAE